MSNLPRRVLLALAALIDIAHHARTEPVSLRAFAERNGLAPRQLEATMQRLSRARIVVSMRGASGGYTLARERRHISVADIVRALEDGQDCYDGPYASAIEAALAPAERALDEALAAVTVEDLLRAAEADLLARPANGYDFTI
jgi:Rrf2 family protein